MGKNPTAKLKTTEKKSESKSKVESSRAKKSVSTKKKVELKSTTEKCCQVKSCKREYRAKGYCGVHYKKWRQGEFGHARYNACTATNCFSPMIQNKHGLCDKHYESIYVRGEKAPAAKPAEKAEEKVAVA